MPRAAQQAVLGGLDRGLGIIGQHDRDGTPALLERAQTRLPGVVAGGQRLVVPSAREPGEVAEQGGDVLEIQQRAAERLVALQQQVGEPARAGQPGAQPLRRGLALQVGGRVELLEQLLRRRRAVLQVGGGRAAEAMGEPRPVVAPGAPWRAARAARGARPAAARARSAPSSPQR